MVNNQFIRMRRHIEKIVGDYENVLRECKTNEKWHSETIYRMAYPYLHGCFTLAVIGDMSSGKSTFINTLIGVNILPTGHFQTTSAITYIEHGTQASMSVKYADGHEEKFDGNKIKSILHDLVALPEEYKDLPINDINLLISGGDTLNDILAKKDGIEKSTHSKVCDIALWKKYVNTHPKSSIASEVYVFYPLSEEMQGWRIVDTPGVGAIGGIQEATKRMFSSRDKDGNKQIDAIIFLKRGDSNIESESDITFFENVFGQLTNEARERLFFVMTHATAQKFRLYHDEIIKMAQRTYGEKFNIPNSRLTHVDSLMARFHDSIIAQGLLATDIDPDIAEPLEGWSIDECNAMYEMYSPIKRELKNRNLAINNENLLSLMEEWGNFGTLKNLINNFVREVKEKSFQKIVSMINEDYLLMKKKGTREIEILKGGQKVIDAESDRLKHKKIEYNNVLNKLRRLGAIEPILKKFEFVDEKLRTLSDCKSIDEVRVAYQNLMEEATTVEHRTFEDLESEFKVFCNDYDSQDIILKQIDFETLEKKAQENSTDKIPVYDTEEYKTGGWSSEKKTKTVYVRTDTRVNQEKKLREFTAYVLNEARPIVNSFKEQLKRKIEILCDLVHKDIYQKIEAEEKRLEELHAKSQNSQQEEAVINKHLSVINENVKNLNS